MKKILISLILLSIVFFNLPILSAENITYINIDKIEIIEEKNIIKITSSLNTTNNVLEFGILLGKGYQPNLKLGDENSYKIEVNSLKQDHTFTVSIIMPERAFKDTMTIKAYVITKDSSLIYTDETTTSYHQELFESTISTPTVTKSKTGLRFESISNVSDAKEYGFIINKGIIENDIFDINYCLNNPSTTLTITSPNLTNSNSLILNLDNFPARAYYQKITIKSYIKYLDKDNNPYYIYSKDVLITSYYEIINKEILSNITTSYKKSFDGIRFELNINANLNIENDLLEIGIIAINKDVEYLDINTEGVYIEKFNNINQTTYALILINIPKESYNQTISAIGYLKYLDLEGNIHYYYSKEITKTTYNTEINKQY